VSAWARVGDLPVTVTSATNGQIAVGGQKGLWLLVVPQ